MSLVYVFPSASSLNTPCAASCQLSNWLLKVGCGMVSSVHVTRGRFLQGYKLLLRRLLCLLVFYVDLSRAGRALQSSLTLLNLLEGV